MSSHQSVLLHAMRSAPNQNRSDKRWATTSSYGRDLGATTSERCNCLKPPVAAPQKVSVAAVASVFSKVLRVLLHWEKRKGQNSSEKTFSLRQKWVLPTGSSGGCAIPLSKLAHDRLWSAYGSSNHRALFGVPAFSEQFPRMISQMVLLHKPSGTSGLNQSSHLTLNKFANKRIFQTTKLFL